MASTALMALARQNCELIAGGPDLQPDRHAVQGAAVGCRGELGGGTLRILARPLGRHVLAYPSVRFDVVAQLYQGECLEDSVRSPGDPSSNSQVDEEGNDLAYNEHALDGEGHRQSPKAWLVLLVVLQPPGCCRLVRLVD
jgi:hypothetical protein